MPVAEYVPFAYVTVFVAVVVVAVGFAAAAELVAGVTVEVENAVSGVAVNSIAGVAVADAPPNIDAALEAAYHSAAIYFPFTDLIVADPYKDMAEGLTLAYYIGQSKVVGDTTTDMVAYVDHGVFVQMWVGVEDKLPRLLHAVFLNDPERLRHNLILSNWKLDDAIPADEFTSAKAASANPMPFAHPHPTPPPDAPPEKKKPAKSH